MTPPISTAKKEPYLPPLLDVHESSMLTGSQLLIFHSRVFCRSLLSNQRIEVCGMIAIIYKGDY